MWLSRTMVRRQPEAEPAVLGTVSIGGADAAVVTDGEKRHARLISPGGYCWQPGAEDGVLVLKGSELYVAGALQPGGEIAPGEVLIYSNGASIWLKNTGEIELCGRVNIRGEAYVNDRKVKTE